MPCPFPLHPHFMVLQPTGSTSLWNFPKVVGKCCLVFCLGTARSKCQAGTASSRSSLHQSLIRVGIKTPCHHSGGTLWRYVFNTVLEIFFPTVELQLPSVLTCLIRQLIGCFPLSSLSYKGFLHLQNKLLALESSIKGLLLENSK